LPLTVQKRRSAWYRAFGAFIHHLIIAYRRSPVLSKSEDSG